jgi:hypothetical protein
VNGLFVSIGAGPSIGGSTVSRFAGEGFDLVQAARDVSKLEPSAQKIRKEMGGASRQSLLTPQISVPFRTSRKGLAQQPAFFTTTPPRYKNRTCLRRLLKRRSAI